MTIDALIDSNVLIAILAGSHEHHAPSLALLLDHPDRTFAVAAHSYAETYNTLTRQGMRAPFQFTPEEAWAALESVRAVTRLVGLTAPQTFDAIRSYAAAGGIGTRLYDRLIGEAAITNAIPRLVTWNAGHMRSLFPALIVTTPAEFAATVC